MFTIVLSGPARTLHDAEVALDLADVPILPAEHHTHMGSTASLPALASGEDPDERQATLTVQHADINVPADAVAEHKWVLRLHYATPEPLALAPASAADPTVTELVATVADMRREIEALKRQKAGRS
jgi:hypothetical protein